MTKERLRSCLPSQTTPTPHTYSFMSVTTTSIVRPLSSLPTKQLPLSPHPSPQFGFDDAPHGHAEVHFREVTVPASNVVLGLGRGFEIAQGRLGPGRLHHCMRLIGAGNRALRLGAERALGRTAFGKRLADLGSFRENLAK